MYLFVYIYVQHDRAWRRGRFGKKFTFYFCFSMFFD